MDKKRANKKPDEDGRVQRLRVATTKSGKSGPIETPPQPPKEEGDGDASHNGSDGKDEAGGGDTTTPKRSGLWGDDAEDWIFK
jgi:hypothetical protein